MEQNLAEETNNQIRVLESLAEDLFNADRRVTNAETELERAKNAQRELAERVIPEALEELGVESFDTATLRLEIKETIRAGLTEANKAAGIAWLIANGHGKIVKHELRIPIGKGSEEFVEAVKNFVKSKNPAVRASDQPSVHSQSLAALVREQLSEGREIPLETLGVHRQRAAKVTVKKSSQA
jgi:hypothetical protein